MFLSANPLVRGGHLFGPPADDSVAAFYPGAWAAASGRTALAEALRRLGAKPGQKIVLPAYLCPSVLTPLAHLGLMPAFYDLGRDLTPDLAALSALLPGAAGLVVIHYWGFPQPIEEIRETAASAGVPLIEDCALSLFSRIGRRPLGSFGQAAIFSLPKSLPLADGGLLWQAGRNSAGPRPNGANRAGLARLLAYRSEAMVGQSVRTYLLSSPGVRRRAYSRNERPGAWGRPISRTSWAMAQRISAGRLITARRRRFLNWLEILSGRPGLEPIFKDLPDGVCPLGFPILMEPGSRDRIRDALHRRGVAVRSYWDQLPGLITADRFPEACRLSRRVLTLPVHEDIPEKGVAHIVRWLGLWSQ